MNKDLRKVVILLAHPNIKGSQANKALIDAVSDIEGVAVFNLYELSEDIAFNVDEWSKIISDASAVIYQFPFYWMSAPSLLKKWQDEVFTHLSKTPAVAGKPLMIVTTTGSEYDAYREIELNQYLNTLDLIICIYSKNIVARISYYPIQLLSINSLGNNPRWKF